MYRVEINSGFIFFFWYVKWLFLGILIEVVGERGSMDLGIFINFMVEWVV